MSLAKVMWVALAVGFTVFFALAPGLRSEEQGNRVVRKLNANAGDVWILPELGAVVIASDSALRVDIVQPSEQRPEAYRSVDLREGDLILMFNGKRVADGKALEKAYDAAAIGDTVKLGIRRGTELAIASFVKADPKTLPQRRMVIKTDGRGGNVEEFHGDPGTKMIRLNGGEGDVTPIPAAGILVAEKNMKVTVAALLPESSERLRDAAITEKDVIIEAQGKAVTSAKQLANIIDAVPVGEVVSLKVEHNGKTISTSFKKQDVPDRVIIKK